MTLVGMHLGARRTFLVSWTLGTLVYLLMIGSVYATVADSAEYEQLWQNYPEELRAAFGGAESITSVDGFLQSQALSYLPLVLGIVGVMAATKGLAGAEERGTLDHWLARPLSRRRYARSHLVSVAVLLGGILAGATVGAVAGFAISGVGARELGRVVLAFVNLVPIAFLWLALGALVGAAFHRSGPANGAGVGLVLASFVLDVLSRLVEAVSWLEFVTPFGLLARSDGFHGAPDPVYLVASFAVGGLLWWLALRAFDRKDLYA